MTENEAAAASALPRMLLVEDDPAFANLLKWVLDGAMEVELRESLEEVLELVEQNWPDFIVSDLHMPRTTGIEIYKVLQAHPTGKDIPFALLTGAYEADRLKAPLPKAREAGIEVIFSKDLGLDGLREHIERFYAEQFGQPS